MADALCLPPTAIIQNCWVVDDLDAAMAGWLAMGVGPFYRFDVSVPNARYRGTPVPLFFTAACAQAGTVQIELIDQHSDGPSAYRDVVPAGRSGFHHVCRAFGAYDETLATLAAQGALPVTEADLGGTRFCYVDTRDTIGCMLEVCDNSEAGTRMGAHIRAGAEGWDGRDPVRALDFAALFPA